MVGLSDCLSRRAEARWHAISLCNAPSLASRIFLVLQQGMTGNENFDLVALDEMEDFSSDFLSADDRRDILSQT